MIFDWEKSGDASDNVKVIDAVSPIKRLPSSVEIVIVGAIESTLCIAVTSWSRSASLTLELMFSLLLPDIEKPSWPETRRKIIDALEGNVLFATIQMSSGVDGSPVLPDPFVRKSCVAVAPRQG